MLVSYRPLAQLLLPRHRPNSPRQAPLAAITPRGAHAYNHKPANQAQLLNNDAESHNLCTDIAPATLALIRKYLVAHDTPLYNVARDRLLKELKEVERATGARLGKTCGVDGDDDDGDDDASPAGFGVGHASYKAAFPNAASSGPGGK